MYSTACPFTSAHTLAVFVQSNSLYYFNLTNPLFSNNVLEFCAFKTIEEKVNYHITKAAQGFLRKLRVCTKAYLL